MSQSRNKRTVFIMRHAERVDFTFGDWIHKSFTESGVYMRKDLNMPVSVPSRSGSPCSFFKDCPLTNIGICQATVTGQAMKECGVTFSNVFASPSLRCVETCTDVLKGAGQADLPINIEPGLFEWLSWYHDGMPTWMTLEELTSAGFNVAMTYKPVVIAAALTNTSETIEDYYVRSYMLMQNILDNYKEGNLLLVGHAATLDTCTRQLVGHGPRVFHQFQSIIFRTPYASVVTVEEDSDRKYKLTPAPLPSGSLMHCNNINYDWNVLNS